MEIFDHDDGRVDHGADRDSDAAQRHDVGVDALDVHHDERGQNAQRQRQQHHQRRAEMEQEQHAHQHHDDEFLHQLFAQRVDCALDQVRAVVGGDDLDAFGQAALELGQPFLDPFDGGQRVAAETHHDDAADGFPFAVELADAAPEIRAVTHFGDVANQHRYALVGGLERNAFQVLQRVDVACCADHVFGFSHFDHPAAGFHVAALDGVAHLR